MLAGRNQQPLTEEEIKRCQETWDFLCSDMKEPLVLDVSEANTACSKTRFNEGQQKVFLGADAYPGSGTNSTSKMSVLACLAHELAHWERYKLLHRRPTYPHRDYLLDEAETSIHASFISVLNPYDREHLVGDAHDRLIDWINHH